MYFDSVPLGFVQHRSCNICNKSLPGITCASRPPGELELLPSWDFQSAGESLVPPLWPLVGTGSSPSPGDHCRLGAFWVQRSLRCSLSFSLSLPLFIEDYMVMACSMRLCLPLRGHHPPGAAPNLVMLFRARGGDWRGCSGPELPWFSLSQLFSAVSLPTTIPKPSTRYQLFPQRLTSCLCPWAAAHPASCLLRTMTCPPVISLLLSCCQGQTNQQ